MINIEIEYLQLMREILNKGKEKQDRTGTGTKSVFGRMITHDMSLGFPMLTTKKVFFKAALTEILWILKIVQRLVFEERGGALMMSRFVSPRESDMIASLMAWIYQSASIGRFGCNKG